MYELVDPFSELTTYSHSENWLVWKFKNVLSKKSAEESIFNNAANFRRYFIDFSCKFSVILGTVIFYEHLT